MGKLSRTKGRAFEQWVAKWMRDCVGIDAKRQWQFRGGGEQPDVRAGCFSIEAKHQKAPNVRKALQQAVENAAPGEYPVAICAWHGERKRDAVVAMRLEDWGELVREWHERGSNL